ncbi:hypothetical protein M0R04_15730 [Candidatus Dojkabacteria bacterium]|jgi:hypothetical protein|nr:hypothetical protein [Candidatus Dojkabacteria bacterium]
MSEETELKTLKDFRPNSFLLEAFDSDSFVVDARMLKQEAIKWVKHELEGWSYNIEGDSNPRPHIVLSAWIKHFFNLTEEDL